MLLRLFRRGRRSLVLAVLLIASSHMAYSQSDALSLQEAIGLASSRSANAETSRSGIQSALDMAVAAAQLPDPILKFGVNNVPADGSERFSIGTESMTMRSVSVMQEFTRSEKRLARAERFNAEASAAETQRIAALSNVQRNAAQAWLERWYAGRTVQLLAEQAASAALQVEAAEAAYRSNRGSRADIVAARLEWQQLQDRTDEARAAQATATAMLQRWIGNASSRSLAPPPKFDVPPWIDALDDATVDALPEVSVANAQAAVADAEGRVSRAGKVPDVTVELMYSQRGPAFSNMVSLNVSLPLPWDQKNRQDREVSAKLAQANAARAQAETMRRNLMGQLLGTREALRLNQRRLNRYRETTVPLARAQTEAALTAYRTGGGSLAAVAEASRKALDLALERLKLEASTAQLWAELTFLKPLPTADQPIIGVQP
ncbi:TolC family protein [Ralstonia solanacearum]|uniref:TolC family protein n=1 Tax=Ralstonia solanacearum TaxID=305 RepID=UPI0005ACA3B1|nr:TolC family protein [Ralstonia solanacearum]MDC6177099.1 TolC family protein [Ralstonia solanacearum]MDC6238369.1 TolC family protein [Ralstonia solanacearum]